MRTRVTVVGLSVCLSVCVCLCVTNLAPAYNKLNLPAWSSLNSKGFQLADLAKKLSFPSYGMFSLLHSPRRPFAIIKVAMWQVQLTTITYTSINSRYINGSQRKRRLHTVQCMG